MNAVVPIISRVQMHVSDVTYACDLSRHDGRQIPLGVIATLTFGTWFGIGIQARTALADAETGLIGSLARPLLCNPFKTLETEVERLWELPAEADIFANLSSLHRGSLRFEEPSASSVVMPRWIAMRSSDDAIEGYLRDALEHRASNRFWSLMERLECPSDGDKEAKVRQLAA